MDILECYDAVSQGTVPIFHLGSRGASIESIAGSAARKKRKKQTTSALLQNSAFPVAATSLAMTPDAGYLLAAGVHKPSWKVLDLEQVSAKWETHLAAECRRIVPLAADWRKAALLRTDGHVDFMSHSGKYAEIHTPFTARDLEYNWDNCDLYLAGNSTQLARLSLETGAYLSCFDCQSDAEGINRVAASKGLPLVGAACMNGTVECFDSRASNKRVGAVRVPNAGELTALRFGDDGLSMVVGTEGGTVALYDLRSSKARMTLDHMNDAPIVQLYFHQDSEGGRMVLSADRLSVRVWATRGSEPQTRVTFAPPAHLNDVLAFEPDRGLFVAACEQEELCCFFAPVLGPAPRWCRYLDSYAEEEADKASARSVAGASGVAATGAAADTEVFRDYRFVPRDEIESMGLGHLIGTNYLKPAMHGFWISSKLYMGAKTVARPEEWEAMRKDRTRAQIEQERHTRVTQPSAAAVLADNERGESARVNKKLAQHKSLAKDSRFGAMFENPEFAAEEEDPGYKQLVAGLESRSRMQSIAKEATNMGEAADQVQQENSFATKRLAAMGTMEASFSTHEGRSSSRKRDQKKGAKGKKKGRR